MVGILFYVGTACFSIGAFVLGAHVGRRSRRAALSSCALAMVLILCLAVLHARPAWEAALFPWCSYVYLQSYWVYPIGLFFLGLAVTQLPAKGNRVAIRALALTLFAGSLWSERWMVLPPDDSSTEAAQPDHHCRQTTSYTCVPAACVSVLSYWGVKSTEGEMVRLCRTRPTGTTLFNAFRGLRLKLRGTRHRVRILAVGEREFTDLRVPVLFCGGGRHAVVMWYDGETVTFVDPSELHSKSRDLAALRDQLTGAGVVVLPP